MAPPKGHIPWNKGIKGWNKKYKNAGFQKKNMEIKERKMATQEEIDRSFINIRKDFNMIGRDSIKVYEIPCHICGKIQIRHTNIKTTLCHKHTQELRKGNKIKREVSDVQVP